MTWKNYVKSSYSFTSKDGKYTAKASYADSDGRNVASEKTGDSKDVLTDVFNEVYKKLEQPKEEVNVTEFMIDDIDSYIKNENPVGDRETLVNSLEEQIKKYNDETKHKRKDALKNILNKYL